MYKNEQMKNLFNFDIVNELFRKSGSRLFLQQNVKRSGMSSIRKYICSCDPLKSVYRPIQANKSKKKNDFFFAIMNFFFFRQNSTFKMASVNSHHSADCYCWSITMTVHICSHLFHALSSVSFMSRTLSSSTEHDTFRRVTEKWAKMFIWTILQKSEKRVHMCETK